MPTALLDQLVTQTIRVSLGASRLTFPITVAELNGKNISADAIQISLGDWNAPGAWVTPTSVTQGATTSQLVIQLLVSSTTAAGYYRVWYKLTDSPEVAVTATNLLVVVA